ncbi:hypothetical protein AGIG_G1346 [Arapaima gigas]
MRGSRRGIPITPPTPPRSFMQSQVADMDNAMTFDPQQCGPSLTKGLRWPPPLRQPRDPLRRIHSVRHYLVSAATSLGDTRTKR